MKPIHKTYRDFPNLYSATKYLDELQQKVNEMERKIDKAHFDFKHKNLKADKEWLRKITTAHKCCHDEAFRLDAEIKAAAKAEKQRQADFYWNFYELAKLTLHRTSFDILQKGARERLNRPVEGDSEQNFIGV